MAHPAVAVLESALRSRKLDRTLTTSLPSLERSDGSALVATGVAGLDACLFGGLPRGALSEFAGPRSSGRTTLLTHLLAAATRRGEIAALVDTCDRLDVASVVDAGVDLERLLWVRGQATTGCVDSGGIRMPGAGSLASGPGRRLAGPQAELVDRVVERALKALNLILQAGGFGVVALDLADVPLAAVKRLPLATWLRVQRTIEGTDTACVLVVTEPLARSARGLTLSLTGCAGWVGEAAHSRRLQGVDIGVRVVSPRRRVDGSVTISTHVADVDRADLCSHA